MVNRVFIYGEFQGADPTMAAVRKFLGRPESDLATEAIEILREPSVMELVGKIYVLTSSRNYQPVTPLGIRNFNWYEQYQRASANRQKFYFKAKDGDLWQVPWMRQESDDSGPYIAVALRHE